MALRGHRGTSASCILHAYTDADDQARSTVCTVCRPDQFAPFAALTGYDDAVAETARLTDNRVDLTEDAVNELNRQIYEASASGREIRIVYFVPDDRKAGGAYMEVVPDDRKAGGAYMEVTGKIRKIEPGEIILEDGSRIRTENIVDAG